MTYKPILYIDAYGGFHMKKGRFVALLWEGRIMKRYIIFVFF